MPDGNAGGRGVCRDVDSPRGPTTIDTWPPMIVRIPGLLRSYTSGAETVELAVPATLGDAVDALEARFPGLRFRIIDEQDAVRPHIKLFVDGALVRNLTEPLATPRELMIIGGLSGG
jgi:molybdopterin synthase sulfur carrier subunit